MTGALAVVLPRDLVLPEDFAHQGIAPKIFSVASRAFVVMWSGHSKHVQLARQLIQSGETAGVMPHAVLRPQAIFFDMDATVIAEESLVEIAKAAGKEREIAELTQRAMAGGMDFATSLRARLRILKGLKRPVIEEVGHTLNPGIQDLCNLCHKLKIPMFLVSGGFVDLAGPLAARLGFQGFAANQFLWEGDTMAGDIQGTLLDGQGKLETISHWCKTYSYDPARCIAVGDGANDLAMMHHCGASVGFLPKPALWPHLSISNQTGSHALLATILSSVPTSL